ncbi:MAG TPA: asparagine synthase [Gammaproteobacteria bacterium]|nr:asparagine synthase [Gammaproteobacteria bacterium]
MSYLLSIATSIHSSYRDRLEALKFKSDNEFTFHQSSSACVLISADDTSCNYFELFPWVVFLQGYPFLQQYSSNRPNVPLDAKNILDLYLSEPTELGTKLSGSYSLVIGNIETGETYCCTDLFASYPIFYFHLNQCFIVSSSAKLLKRVVGQDAPLSHQSIFDYFFFHVIPHPHTPYQNIYRLAPNRFAHFYRASLNHGEIKPYPNKHKHKSFKTLKKELKIILNDTTEQLLNLDGDAGCFLSGGLDSSTVAGLLSAHQSNSQAFSIGFDAEGYDEVPFAQQSADHYDISLTTRYVTPKDVVDFVPTLAAESELPFGNASAVPTYYCALLAKENGKRSLFGGDGGDELFGGNERYLKQQLLWQYDKLPKFLSQKLINPLSPVLPRIGLNKLKSYIQQAQIPLPARLQSYNLLYQLGMENIFNPDFFTNIDIQHPIDLMNEQYHACPAGPTLEKILYTDLQFTLADSDIPKVVNMCHLAGIEVQFPLLDEELINFSRNIPPDLKLKNRELRYFYKKSLADWLPPHTLKKSKHGFGLPFGVWMVQDRRLKEMAFDHLISFKERQILSSEFLDKIANEHLINHPAYYGTFVWLILVLESWLQENTIHH